MKPCRSGRQNTVTARPAIARDRSRHTVTACRPVGNLQGRIRSQLQGHRAVAPTVRGETSSARSFMVILGEVCVGETKSAPELGE